MSIQKRTAWGTIFLLLLRPLLFISCQTGIAAVFFFTAHGNPWNEAVHWWPFAGILASVLNIIIFYRLNTNGSLLFKELFQAERKNLLKDILTAIAVILASLILVMALNTVGMGFLFKDPKMPLAIMYGKLPFWAGITTVVLLPLLVAVTEIPWYFGYLMKELETSSTIKWLPIVLCAVAFSIQHGALPLVFNVNFVIWRSLMMLPFTLFLAGILAWRKRLLPYFVIAHFLMDLAMTIPLVITE